MIGCNHFIYVHVPKTGGTWARHVLRDKMSPKDRPFDRYGHVGVAEIPPHLNKVPRIAFVRNPWDWFVSMFAFFGGKSIEDFPAYVAKVGPSHYTYCVHPLLVNRSGHIDCQVKKYEDGVADQLADFIDASSCNRRVAAEIRAALMQSPPVNVSMHQPYRDYYTDALSKEIGKANGWAIHRFGYEF